MGVIIQKTRVERTSDEIYNDICDSLHVDSNNPFKGYGYNLIKYFGPQLKNRKFLINDITGGYYFLGVLKKNNTRAQRIIYEDNQSAIMFTHHHRSNSALIRDPLQVLDSYGITLFHLIEGGLPKGINTNSNFGSLNNLAIVSSAFIIAEERIVYDSFALSFTLDKDHLKANGYTIEDVCGDWNWLNYISRVFNECIERHIYKFKKEETY